MLKENDFLEVDSFEKKLSKEEYENFSKLQKEFIKRYFFYKDKMSIEEWLKQELQKQFLEKTPEEIYIISDEIITSIKKTEEMKLSQQKAIDLGRSKESWLSSTLLKSMSHMPVKESAKYLLDLDNAVKNSNIKMNEVIMTKSSGYVLPNQNPNLDGFIAEQYHVNSFNMDAIAKGSDFRAEVQAIKPGNTYTKNGFDVIIKDGTGKRIQQYQMKYGANAKETIRLLKSGNYNNQRIVVPEDQVKDVAKAFPNKKVTSTISAKDIKSRPLTKKQAKDLQKEAQNGNSIDTNWNEYSTKDIALGIGKQAAYGFLQGAAISSGMLVVKKFINDEPIDDEEIIGTAIILGADYGVKIATAGALKTASEKGLLSIIPKGTSGTTIANIAFVGIENFKVFSDIYSGKLSLREGINEIQKITGACIAGITASVKASAIGTTIGTVLGPVGSVVGGLIGGTVGYMAGSKVGEAIVKTSQKIVGKISSVVKSIGSSVASGISKVASSVANFFGF